MERKKEHCGGFDSNMKSNSQSIYYNDHIKKKIHDDHIASFYTVGHILSYIKDNR